MADLAEAIQETVSEAIAEAQAEEAQAEAVEALADSVEALTETVSELAEANTEAIAEAPNHESMLLSMMERQTEILAEVKTLLISQQQAIVEAEAEQDSEAPLELDLPPITQIQEAPQVDKQNPIMKLLFG
jgi:hypothetical protein